MKGNGQVSIKHSSNATTTDQFLGSLEEIFVMINTSSLPF